TGQRASPTRGISTACEERLSCRNEAPPGNVSRLAAVAFHGLSTGSWTTPPTQEAGFAVPRKDLKETRELADDAAAEADGHGMRAGARLELREQVPDVRLD